MNLRKCSAEEGLNVAVYFSWPFSEPGRRLFDRFCVTINKPLLGMGSYQYCPLWKYTTWEGSLPTHNPPLSNTLFLFLVRLFRPLICLAATGVCGMSHSGQPFLFGPNPSSRLHPLNGLSEFSGSYTEDLNRNCKGYKNQMETTHNRQFAEIIWG